MDDLPISLLDIDPRTIKRKRGPAGHNLRMMVTVPITTGEYARMVRLRKILDNEMGQSGQMTRHWRDVIHAELDRMEKAKGLPPLTEDEAIALIRETKSGADL